MSENRNRNAAKWIIWEAVDNIRWRDVVRGVQDYYDDNLDVHTNEVLKLLHTAKVTVSWDEDD